MTIFELVGQVKYDPLLGTFTRPNGKPTFTTKTVHGYRKAQFKGEVLLAHRVAWALTYGHWPPGHARFKNGNRSDCRLCNLRVVTT